MITVVALCADQSSNQIWKKACEQAARFVKALSPIEKSCLASLMEDYQDEASRNAAVDFVQEKGESPAVLRFLTAVPVITDVRIKDTGSVFMLEWWDRDRRTNKQCRRARNLYVQSVDEAISETLAYFGDLVKREDIRW